MPKKTPGKLIFTDLDGTLLDHETYSWKPAEPALREARKKGIPVIFCTSKTRAETESYRKRLGNKHPFIIENGGAIYIPSGYFTDDPPEAVKKGKYLVIQLGRPYKELREAIKKMRKKDLKLTGFGDMSILKLRKLTGLSLREAYLAKKREFDEPFILENPKQEQRLLELIKKLDLQYTKGGRFYHLMKNNDKGLAVKILTSFYQEEAGKPVVTAGIGDSPNDFSMLRAVHIPYLVKGAGGRYASKSPFFIKSDEGPRGWNAAMLKFIREEF